jgi:hypothetical protein
VNSLTRSSWLVLFGLAVGCRSPQAVFYVQATPVVTTSGDSIAGLVSKVRASPKEALVLPLPPLAAESRHENQSHDRMPRVNQLRLSSLVSSVSSARGQQRTARAAVVRFPSHRPVAFVDDGALTNVGRLLWVLLGAAVSLMVSLIGLLAGSWIIGGVGLFGVAVCLILLITNTYRK